MTNGRMHTFEVSIEQFNQLRYSAAKVRIIHTYLLIHRQEEVIVFLFIITYFYLAFVVGVV